VAFAWIFFRATMFKQRFYISKRIITSIPGMLQQIFSGNIVFENLGLSQTDMALSIILIIFLESVHVWQRNKSISAFWAQRPVTFRWAVYYLVVLSILFLGVFENRQFIYFQF
jgi:small-conductance mechanosensitive channel